MSAGGRGESEAPSRAATFLYLGIIVVLWASNWPLLKLVLPDIAPFTFTTIRLVGSALAIGAFLAARRESALPLAGERLRLAVAGIFQIGFMLALSMVGLEFVPPGRAAVLVYTMPLWALPLGFLLAGERATPRRLLGAAVGLTGLVLFFNPALVDWSDPHALFGNGLLIAAAASWALGTALYRRWRWRSAFWTQTGWQLGMSALPLALVALLFERGDPLHVTWLLAGVLLYNWLIATAVSYWCWAKVLMGLSSSAAGQAVMLVPVLAFAMSALFFREPVTMGVLANIALIVLGIVLTLGGDRRRAAPATRPPEDAER